MIQSSLWINEYMSAVRLHTHTHTHTHTNMTSLDKIKEGSRKLMGLCRSVYLDSQGSAITWFLLFLTLTYKVRQCH